MYVSNNQICTDVGSRHTGITVTAAGVAVRWSVSRGCERHLRATLGLLYYVLLKKEPKPFLLAALTAWAVASVASNDCLGSFLKEQTRGRLYRRGR